MFPSRLFRYFVILTAAGILISLIWILNQLHFSFDHHLGVSLNRFIEDEHLSSDGKAHADLTADIDISINIGSNSSIDQHEEVDDTVHVFYYPWYGNPDHDGSYYHWNHEYLSHWDKNLAKRWPTGRHKPPEDIGANFYPYLGLYSSIDPTVLDKHMLWIRWANIGVVVLSYYPKDLADGQGKPWEPYYPLIMDSAAKHGLKVAFHIEPYPGRSGQTIYKDIEYLVNTFGEHPAFYRYRRETRIAAPRPARVGRSLPLVYVYDSYLLESWQWQSLFERIRGGPLDAVVLGLATADESRKTVLKHGFDGYYTYFASRGFTYASDWDNWQYMAMEARQAGALFCPSVGPGYIDTRVRPWNKIAIRPRQNGNYYEMSWKAAIQSRAPIVSITSFNEWHEGTQIEPAVPKDFRKGLPYLDYSPNSPTYYLRLTKEYIRLRRKVNG